MEPPEFFTQIDVLLLPSLWQEPLARVILEAYAYGVPVVGSRRGGIAEHIEDGVTGLLFDPDEPRMLDAAVDRFLREPSLLSRMSQNASGRARENTVARSVADYEICYRDVLRPAEKSRAAP